MSDLQTAEPPADEVARGISNEPEPAPQAAAAQPDEFTTAFVEHLIIGRQLRFPIYDPQGVLLLAANATITREFKERLKGWDLGSVRVHPEDLADVTLAVEGSESGLAHGFDGEMTRKLDETINSGGLFAVNTGPAVMDGVNPHGDSGYDDKQHEEVVQRNRQAGTLLNGLMSDALRGATVDAESVSELASQYVSDMTGDLDSVLATVYSTTREYEIADHCLKMALLGMAVGIAMGLDKDNVRRIGVTGLVHDWGMARVPVEIRQAKRRLSDVEFLEIKKHPTYSVDLLEKCKRVPSQVSLICYQVHERPNGSGYPRNRTGDSIHPFAKILNVADVYRALVSPRPFRPPLKPYAAMECLLRQARMGNVDASVVRALLEVMSLFPIGSYVVLTDGSVARVVRSNGQDYTRPVVQIIQDAEGNSLNGGGDASIVNLSQEDLGIRQALASPGSNEVDLSQSVLFDYDATAIAPTEPSQEVHDAGSGVSRKTTAASAPTAAGSSQDAGI